MGKWYSKCAMLMLVAGFWWAGAGMFPARGVNVVYGKTPIYYQDRVVVLLYHDFKWKESGTAINPQRFRNHLDTLAMRGFKVVSLDEVVAFVRGEKKLPPNAIAITMDDGYTSNYQEAIPLLNKRKWPATVFITISNVGRMEGKYSVSRWLTWSQCQAMYRNNVLIGGHTYNGHFFTTDYTNKPQPWLVARLTKEDEAVYRQRIRNDLVQSQQIQSYWLGAPAYHFAAPYGVYDETVVSVASSCGYKYFWSTEPRAVTRSSKLSRLGRVSVGRKGMQSEDVISKILAAARYGE